MKTLRTSLLSASLLALSFAVSANAQAPMAPMTDHGTSVNGKPLASPAATATTMLAGKSIEIKYNSPSARGRKVAGDVVPYDKVWRTGANPATTLITATDLMIGKLTVPAGTYTLYTQPAAPGTPWQLIVNKQTGQWGTVYKNGHGPRPHAHDVEGRLAAAGDDVDHLREGEEQVGRAAHVRWADFDEYVKVEAK